MPVLYTLREMTRKQWKLGIKSAPEGLTIAQLSKHLNQSYKQTQHWAARFKYNRQSGHLALWTAQRRREFRRVPWDRVPWQLANVVIARKYNVSREIVRRRRKEYGNGTVIR